MNIQYGKHLSVTERMNRALVEMVRSMLSDSSLPKKFWAEALATAGYIRNRSPTAAIEGMTPYEALNGEKPHVRHFTVFGCDAYAHVPKDERGKLDSKAQKCIFLGYGTKAKGYRLYNDKNCKILYSRDVLFNELKPAKESNESITAASKQDENVTVELEFMDEEETIKDKIEESAGEQLRRSKRTRNPPEYFGERVHMADGGPAEPSTVSEARASPEKKKWEKARECEMG